MFVMLKNLVELAHTKPLKKPSLLRLHNDNNVSFGLLSQIASHTCHIMFSLAKYAYIACNPKQREWYDTALASPVIHMAECCQLLLLMTDGRTEKKDLACYAAARYGHLDCLLAVRRFGFQMNARALTEALIHGHAECADYMLRDGCRTEGMSDTYSLAIRGGHLECARTLLRHGVPWDGFEVDIAVGEKNADCLRFLLQNGCTMHPVRAKFSAGCSDVACVKLLREYGMPWSDDILVIACDRGNFDLLKYAIENGCPNPLRIPVRRSARVMEREVRQAGRINWWIPNRRTAGGRR